MAAPDSGVRESSSAKKRLSRAKSCAATYSSPRRFTSNANVFGVGASRMFVEKHRFTNELQALESPEKSGNGRGSWLCSAAASSTNFAWRNELGESLMTYTRTFCMVFRRLAARTDLPDETVQC